MIVVGELSVGPLTRHQRPPPIFKEPTQLTCFSLDDERRFHADQRSLRDYFPFSSCPPIDLFRGHDTFRMRTEDVSEHLDHLLKALLVAPKHDIPSPNFVTWRGVMTKLLCTPYESRDRYTLNILRHANVVYMEEQLSDATLHGIATRSHQEKLLMYSGYRFEHVCTTPRVGSSFTELASDSSVPDNNSACFCTVVRTQLGRHRLILGAEIDARFDGSIPLTPSNCVEFKTSVYIETARQHHSFVTRKLLKFWAQSFLAGVPRIVCGFRNSAGILKSIQAFETMAIPRCVRGKDNAWDPSVCLNFAEHVLNWLADFVKESDPIVTYALSFVPLPQPHLVLSKDDQGSASFLPNWYTEAGPLFQ
jgi:RAT1-interacting protein